MGNIDLLEIGKTKTKIAVSFFLVRDIRSTTNWIIVSSCHVGGENKEKTENLAYFLVGGNISTSEDSLT